MTRQENKKNKAVTTAECLLDTAERLFAEHGYDGVGMRALAAEAGVNLGAATYHYGTKEKLYMETVKRCLRPIGEERIRLLRQAEDKAKGKPIPLESIVECMLRPQFVAMLERPHFPVLFARTLFMPPPFMREFLAQNGGHIHEPFITALSRALPDLPIEVLRIREMFARGVMMMFLSKMPIPKRLDYCEAILKEMVTFIAAGFRSSAEVPGFALPPMPILG